MYVIKNTYQKTAVQFYMHSGFCIFWKKWYKNEYINFKRFDIWYQVNLVVRHPVTLITKRLIHSGRQGCR